MISLSTAVFIYKKYVSKTVMKGEKLLRVEKVLILEGGGSLDPIFISKSIMFNFTENV